MELFPTERCRPGKGRHAERELMAAGDGDVVVPGEIIDPAPGQLI